MKTGSSGSFSNYLPEGCLLCYRGAKMVLFVTGVCGRGCYYCPVSKERQRKDAVFANERAVWNDNDVIEEAESMDALGTGITGGEPLLEPERVVHYIRLLKDRFGESHHIHLYTGMAPVKDTLGALKDAGLDEIRFHPPENMWVDINNSPFRDSLITAVKLGIAAGIEIPCITADYSGILSLLEEVGGFLNLNELEFSETNADELKRKGYETADNVSSGVAGSIGIAESLHGKKLHFCSSVFKDAVQLRERLKRIAGRSARDFDEVTDDGTLVYAVIEGDCALNIIKDACVTEDMYSFGNRGIETAWWIAEDLKDELKEEGCCVSVIEKYPVKNGIVVERTPL
ncbi:MAG: radical SAM protein [Candidatus Methanoperedenaceae archaeon]|nr:radical SAM protein [Candidatus Methanoperedenaceae archaeon]MDW7725636.1 radical SAM protein [Candidatus Methanoperedens sp.]